MVFKDTGQTFSKNLGIGLYDLYDTYGLGVLYLNMCIIYNDLSVVSNNLPRHIIWSDAHCLVFFLYSFANEKIQLKQRIIIYKVYFDFCLSKPIRKESFNDGSRSFGHERGCTGRTDSCSICSPLLM